MPAGGTSSQQSLAEDVQCVVGVCPPSAGLWKDPVNGRTRALWLNGTNLNGIPRLPLEIILENHGLGGTMSLVSAVPIEHSDLCPGVKGLLRWDRKPAIVS